LVLAGAYPAAISSRRSSRGVVGFLECFLGQYHPGLNEAICRLARAAGLPLVSFLLFSTYQPLRMRPDRGSDGRPQPAADFHVTISGVSSYPHDGFHSLKPTRPCCRPRALMRFSPWRLEVWRESSLPLRRDILPCHFCRGERLLF